MKKNQIFGAAAICCLAVAGGLVSKSLAHDSKKDNQVLKSSISLPEKGMQKNHCACPPSAQCP